MTNFSTTCMTCLFGVVNRGEEAVGCFIHPLCVTGQRATVAVNDSNQFCNVRVVRTVIASNQMQTVNDKRQISQ